MRTAIYELLGGLVLGLLLMVTTVRADEVRGDRDWIGRSWEFNYLMLARTPRSMANWVAMGKKGLALGDPNTRQLPEAIFPYITLMGPEDPKASEWDRQISTLVITFDQKGRVTSPYGWKPGLIGHINRLMEVSLAIDNSPSDLIFNVGTWYTGASSDETQYTPAICSDKDMEKRYKRDFKADRFDSFGTFGCREWGYYLKSDEHPYIDVTSYFKDGSTYIRPFIGWGRFDTPPKPVIGKQGKAWMCLHDCPGGAAPGVISDIAVWADRKSVV
jgi:hypothetical protein